MKTLQNTIALNNSCSITIYTMKKSKDGAVEIKDSQENFIIETFLLNNNSLFSAEFYVKKDHDKKVENKNKGIHKDLYSLKLSLNMDLTFQVIARSSAEYKDKTFIDPDCLNQVRFKSETIFPALLDELKKPARTIKNVWLDQSFLFFNYLLPTMTLIINDNSHPSSKLNKIYHIDKFKLFDNINVEKIESLNDDLQTIILALREVANSDNEYQEYLKSKNDKPIKLGYESGLLAEHYAWNYKYDSDLWDVVYEGEYDHQDHKYFACKISDKPKK